jgi:hypothetical protein
VLTSFPGAQNAARLASGAMGGAVRSPKMDVTTIVQAMQIRSRGGLAVKAFHMTMAPTGESLMTSLRCFDLAGELSGRGRAG